MPAVPPRGDSRAIARQGGHDRRKVSVTMSAVSEAEAPAGEAERVNVPRYGSEWRESILATLSPRGREGADSVASSALEVDVLGHAPAAASRAGLLAPRNLTGVREAGRIDLSKRTPPEISEGEMHLASFDLSPEPVAAPNRVSLGGNRMAVYAQPQQQRQDTGDDENAPELGDVGGAGESSLSSPSAEWWSL